MSALVLDIKRLSAITTSTRSARPSVNGSGPSGAISAEVLAETLDRYPTCRCEERVGLKAGIAVSDLMYLNSGCTSSEFKHGPGYICPRLDTIRRRYGK